MYNSNSNKQCGCRVRPTWYAPLVCNPDLSPFDLETGVRVASKVGNFRSKFGFAVSLGSRIIRCVRDGWTDRRTDKSNAYCPLPCSQGHNNSIHDADGGDDGDEMMFV